MKRSVQVRSYNPKTDYPPVAALYKDKTTYGGQFDIARDSEEKLRALSNEDERKILVATVNNDIVGTVTLFEDRRAAWLYRFAVIPVNEQEITQALYSAAVKILKSLGHSQVLVYAPSKSKKFSSRYSNLGMTKGATYTAYWKDI